ncbi:MAG: UPF0175 family protein [Synechococcales cyanobacterium RM1_1_8]|nr:UPF0175 family protein [Synechococcales cyanobacterium RM1_1_8]
MLKTSRYLPKAPTEFAQRSRWLAAVKWYEMGEVSRGLAAMIAGMGRSRSKLPAESQFIASLCQFQVSPFQYAPGELAEELSSIR